MLDINRYLDRINFKGPILINEECFKKLHRCHLLAIPFEALDVSFGNKINLNLELIFKKVIEDNRGGYCYELNYLFNWLLSEIGFESHIISAKVYSNEKYGPEFDHMAICVKMGETWLADVGFGDIFIEPIMIKPNVIQEDQFKNYKLISGQGDEYILVASLKDNVEFVNEYKFTTRIRTISEFEDQNKFKQFSEESHFVKNMICTIATEFGRKTIYNDIYKERGSNSILKKEIQNENELHRLLEEEFMIKIY